VDYLERFATYVSGLEASREPAAYASPAVVGREYPIVMHPERVSDWERMFYRVMVAAGLKPIPQFSVEQYDLDFAIVEGERKLAIEVDGERYHRSWTGELCLRDQLRNQRLIELGWDVRRFWVYEIRDEPDRCIQKLKEWVGTVQQNTIAA
jgi:very-short-patch-repair endonuclease